MRLAERVVPHQGLDGAARKTLLSFAPAPEYCSDKLRCSKSFSAPTKEPNFGSCEVGEVRPALVAETRTLKRTPSWTGRLA
jgi:hypothetical protein